MIIKCPNNGDETYYKKFKFPAGEPHIQLNLKNIKQNQGVVIEFNFTSSQDIVELLLLAHTLRINQNVIYKLVLPYMPFGQADRVNEVGECFSLQLFCQLINDIIRPFQVVVHDPHSYVTPALLNNCVVVPQHELFFTAFRTFQDKLSDEIYLICPDGGAAKKIHEAAKGILGCEVVYCEKVRNTCTGEITGTKVYHDDFQGRDCIILDDLCVGGRTFIEIAKILCERNAGRIILYTTNGCYSKGLSVFDGLIDEIWNQYGCVKPEINFIRGE